MCHLGEFIAAVMTFLHRNSSGYGSTQARVACAGRKQTITKHYRSYMLSITPSLVCPNLSCLCSPSPATAPLQVQPNCEGASIDTTAPAGNSDLAFTSFAIPLKTQDRHLELSGDLWSSPGCKMSASRPEKCGWPLALEAQVAGMLPVRLLYVSERLRRPCATTWSEMALFGWMPRKCTFTCSDCSVVFLT